MKKVLLLAAVAATMGLTACGGKTEQPVEAVDSVIVDEAAEALDAATTALENGDAEEVQTAIVDLQGKIEALVAEGNVEEAEGYKSRLLQWYKENKEKVDNTVSEGVTIQQLVETVTNLPTTAEDVAKAGVEAAKADGEKAAEDLNAAVQQKTNEVVNAAQQKANEKVNEAAQKANAKVNEAVQNAAGKLLGK